MKFLGKNTGMGCHFLLQGVFLTQGLNSCLLHWQVGSLPLSHQRSPNQLCSSLYHIFVAVLEKCQRRVSGTSAAAAFKKLYLGASSLHLVEILDSWITGNIQLSLNLKKKKRNILYLLLYFFYSFEKTLMLQKIEGRKRRG